MVLYTYEIHGSNGDHIYFDNQNYAILSSGLTGLSGYPVTYSTIAPVGQIGEIFSSQTIGRRTLSLPVAILGDNRRELEVKRQRLISALSPLGGECKVIWNREDGTTLWCRCRPDDGMPLFREGTLTNDHIWECDMDMVAVDPCWYSGSEYAAELRGFVGGFKLPFTLPATFGGVGTTLDFVNPGDAPAPCRITLCGYLETPTVTNLTTGESITIRRTIEQGESLVIDTTPGRRSVTLNNILTGQSYNALAYTTIGSSFFSLPPGQVRVTYSAADEAFGAVGYIQFTPRWLSI